MLNFKQWSLQRDSRVQLSSTLLKGALKCLETAPDKFLQTQNTLWDTSALSCDTPGIVRVYRHQCAAAVGPHLENQAGSRGAVGTARSTYANMR